MKLKVFYILLGLFIGFFMIYITYEPPKIIVKYPTIDNIEKTIYTDNNSNCYKYYAKETSCNN
jgi:hypothetical protein